MTSPWVRRSVISLLMTTAVATFLGQQAHRPRITGISHMCVYSADAAATEHFYTVVLQARKASDPEDPNGVRYYFSDSQFVEVLPLPAGNSDSRMSHVAFNTDNVAGLRTYLIGHGAAHVSVLQKLSDHSQTLSAKDPEGNVVQFVQAGATKTPTNSKPPISTRVIHIGFLVHDRAAEDQFYKALLGFRPYWYGASQPGKTDWISQQVPDGHDWLEYMMVGEGSTTPANHVDQRQLGVLNHFSLGVVNMERSVTILIAGDRLSPRHDGPQMGKDGKWQANFYDPDGTRVELMEFQPVMKPCCSPFTAASPID